MRIGIGRCSASSQVSGVLHKLFDNSLRPLVKAHQIEGQIPNFKDFFLEVVGVSGISPLTNVRGSL